VRSCILVGAGMRRRSEVDDDAVWCGCVADF
jgi:hypothetical protein